MSQTNATNTDEDQPQCIECNQRFPSMDELVDHLSDEHDAFTSVVADHTKAGEDE